MPPPKVPVPLAMVAPESITVPELIVRTVPALFPEMVRLSAPSPMMFTWAPVVFSVPSALLSVMVLGELNWKAMFPVPLELDCVIAV